MLGLNLFFQIISTQGLTRVPSVFGAPGWLGLYTLAPSPVCRKGEWPETAVISPELLFLGLCVLFAEIISAHTAVGGV